MSPFQYREPFLIAPKLVHCLSCHLPHHSFYSNSALQPGQLYVLLPSLPASQCPTGNISKLLNPQIGHTYIVIPITDVILSLLYCSSVILSLEMSIKIHLSILRLHIIQILIDIRKMNSKYHI